jgi:hypothetical protein
MASVGRSASLALIASAFHIGCGPDELTRNNEVESQVGVTKRGLCSPTNYCAGGAAKVCSPNCVDFQIEASASYSPNAWNDGAVCSCRPMKIAIPQYLPVTGGSAGGWSNVATLYLTYPATALLFPSQQFACHYRGSNGGTRYSFSSCTNLLVPGFVVEVDRFALHITQGDSSAGTTTVSLEIEEHRGSELLDPLGHCEESNGTLNVPPSFTSVADLFAVAEEQYSYDANAPDPNGDNVSYSLGTSPSGMTVVPTSGLVEWIPTATQEGQHSVRIVAEDTHGACEEQAYTLTVYPPASPPVITSTARRQRPRTSSISIR